MLTAEINFWVFAVLSRSRRTWKPNVQTKRIFSLALDHYIRINLTTHALRCIDKAGGLDEYLLNIPDRKLENENAVFWKRKIASVYDMLARTEIAIPVQNPVDGTFSMEARFDPFPTDGNANKNNAGTSAVNP